MKPWLRKLRGRSLDEWRVRGTQWLDARVDRAALAIRGSRPWPTASLPTTPANWLGARPTLAYLRASDAPESLARFIARTDPAYLYAHRRSADALARGRCSLLGLEGLDIGNPPRWHHDAASGKSVPLAHWSVVDYLDAEAVGDHKVLWELNRHQYLLSPAIAWLVDKNPAHFDLIQRHLTDWLAENPPRVGVNWSSSLEVAYRSIAWIWLLWILRTAPWDGVLLARMEVALRANARHVERHLSTYFSPNTHLTGEALGLFYIGTVLPEAPEARRWRAIGARVLETWLDRQVSPDGTYFEHATQYQRYTAEIYLHYFLMASASGWPVASKVRSSLERQFDVLRSLVDSRGHMPLIGDDDGGFLLPLDGLPPHDLSGLLLAGATVFERPDLRVPGHEPTGSAAWLCGQEATTEQLARSVVPPSWTDLHFRDGGLTTLRSGWGVSDAVAVVDAGPHGAMNCGHAHSDALSMTLSLGPQPVFIDRGTCAYVGADRNPFRETASHNTLEFDDESSVVPLGPFKWGPRAPGPVGRLKRFGPIAILDAEAMGHSGTGRVSVHRRVVLRGVGGAWVVFDSGTRPGSQTGIVRWQLAPRLSALEVADELIQLSTADGTLVAWLASCGVLARRITTRDVSLRLRHREPAQVIELETGPGLQALTVVVPATVGGARPVVAARGDSLGQQVRWSDPSGNHLLLWSGDVPCFEQGGWSGSAAVAWWTHSSAASPQNPEGSDWLVTVAATRLVSPEGVNLVSSPPPERGITGAFGHNVTGWNAAPVEEPRRGQE